MVMETEAFLFDNKYTTTGKLVACEMLVMTPATSLRMKTHDAATKHTPVPYTYTDPIFW